MSESIDIRELNARIEQQCVCDQHHRRHEPRDRGPAAPRRIAAHRSPLRRPRAAGGRARTGQDVGHQHPFETGRCRLQPHPVYPRLAPRRRGGHDDLLAEGGALPREEGSRLCQLRAGRRDQPRARQGAERAAGGHAGAPGDNRRGDLRPPQALPRHGHTEPHRAGGHLPAARGPGGPLHAQGHHRLPHHRGVVADSTWGGGSHP